MSPQQRSTPAPSAPRWLRLPAAAAALTVALLAAACGDGGEPPATPDAPPSTEIGGTAPTLAGTDAEGNRWELDRRRGAGTVVVFFRSYACGLCRERLRELEANSGRYRDAGAAIVAVTPDSPEAARTAAEQLGLSFPVISADSATLQRWGVIDEERPLPLPGSYVVDSRGVVTFRHIGRNAADRAHDLEILSVLLAARS